MEGLCSKPDQAVAITVLEEDRPTGIGKAPEKNKDVVILSDTATSEIQTVEPVVQELRA